VSGGALRTLAARYREQPRRIVDELQAQADRLTALNPLWRAYRHLAPDTDAEAARLADELAAGRDRGPLHGVPVGIKGCFPVAGLPWTEGTASWADRIAGRDAAVVAALRRAGAIVLGTTTLSELAMYAPDNPFEPMGLNPFAPQRTAGGSSTGGGVGAALGLGLLHVGTDSGGSVRNPACHCGVVGFMPSAGRLPTEGLIDRTPSLTRVGLIARSVDDVRLACGVLAGEGEGSVADGATLLVPTALIGATADAATRALFDDVLSRLEAAGWRLVAGAIDGWREAEPAAGVISQAEAATYLTADDLRAASGRVRERQLQGSTLDPVTVAEARARCAAFDRALRAALATHGAAAVLTPTWPFPAPPVDASTVSLDGREVALDPHRNVFVRAANAADATAISLPGGLYAEARVPFGVHLMAPHGADATLLALAARIEAVLGPGVSPPPVGPGDHVTTTVGRVRGG